MRLERPLLDIAAPLYAAGDVRRESVSTMTSHDQGPAADASLPNAATVAAAAKPMLFGLRRVAVIEIVLFLAIALVIDIFLLHGSRFREAQPHPFWLLILLISVQYGSAEGMTAAAACTLAFLVGAIPPQKLGQDFYDYLFAVVKLPVLWFAVAVTLGEIRARHRRTYDELAVRYEELRGRSSQLSIAYRRLVRVKENLEIRVVGQLRTFLTTYETARLIERSDPGEVLLAIVDVVRSVITPEKFSLFLLNDEVLEAAIQDGWQPEDRFARTLDSASPLYHEVVDQKRVVCITNELDEGVLGREGVLAGPLVNAQTGGIIGMLKIEKLELLDLNVSTVENFRALSLWIGTAYAKAVDTAAQTEEAALSAGRDVMPWQYFEPQQYFLASLARRAGFDLSAIRLQFTNLSALPERERGAIHNVVSAAVRLALGASAMPFAQETAGAYVVLIPNMTASAAQAAAERLGSSLRTQLRDAAPEARFESAVQSLYHNERGEAGRERGAL